ncbi:hypothetical protein [Maricaulis sp.]|uniref:hypothetical protein n=1 Tax=Maricaulis sp. TaxID=1486257 RepID=UPI003A940BFF
MSNVTKWEEMPLTLRSATIGDAQVIFDFNREIERSEQEQGNPRRFGDFSLAGITRILKSNAGLSTVVLDKAGRVVATALVSNFEFATELYVPGEEDVPMIKEASKLAVDPTYRKTELSFLLHSLRLYETLRFVPAEIAENWLVFNVLSGNEPQLKLMHRLKAREEEKVSGALAQLLRAREDAMDLSGQTIRTFLPTQETELIAIQFLIHIAETRVLNRPYRNQVVVGGIAAPLTLTHPVFDRHLHQLVRRADELGVRYGVGLAYEAERLRLQYLAHLNGKAKYPRLFNSD